jgi:hypothetical protein
VAIRSRTGTKTLNEALTILLDGPVHDSGIQSTGGTSLQIKQWMEIMDLAPRAETDEDNKRLDGLIGAVLDGYVATMDCPASLLTPELMRVFPDAIVLATTRDPESWWRSMQLVQGLTANWYIPLVLLWVPKVGTWGLIREKFRILALWRYGRDTFGPDGLALHEAHLREVVPEDKLFWYQVKDGWEPLCKILKVPVPKVPFPHNNSAADAKQIYDDLVMAGCFMWIVVVSGSLISWWVLRNTIWK